MSDDDSIAYGFAERPTSLIQKDRDRYGNRRWVVSTNPSTEPVTLKQVKDWGRIDGTLDDDMIENMIETARKAAEMYTGRAFIEQHIQVFMDFWPAQSFDLPVGPLISTVSVATLDESGTATEYDSDNYYAVETGMFPILNIKREVAWPYNTERYYMGYRVQYKAGYGSSAGNVPQPIKDAVKLWAVQIYESRIPSTEPPSFVKELLDPFKVIHL